VLSIFSSASRTRASPAVTSGGKDELSFAWRAVRSRDRFHRTGDAKLALHIAQSCPAAIPAAQRMPHVPIAGGKHELSFARRSGCSDHCRYRTGDAELALHISQPRPAAIPAAQRVPQVPIAGGVMGLRA
jgi:hypothetical protein